MEGRADKIALREAVAAEYGISLFKRYSEAEAANFLQIDHTTLKKMRRAGKVPYVALGERLIRYLGIDIVDLILFGDKWRDIKDASSKSDSIGFPNGKVAPLGTGHGRKPVEPDVFPLAQTIFQKPSKN